MIVMWETVCEDILFPHHWQISHTFSAEFSNSTSGGSAVGSRFLLMTSFPPRTVAQRSPTARTRTSGGPHSWRKLMPSKTNDSWESS